MSLFRLKVNLIEDLKNILVVLNINTNLYTEFIEHKYLHITVLRNSMYF